MIKKRILSLRTRLVIITVAILALCCIGLTLIINYTATLMTSQVAQLTVPAHNINEDNYSFLDPSINYEDDTIHLQQHQIVENFYQNSILYMLFIIIIGGILMYIFSKKILLPLAFLNDNIKNRSITNLSEKLMVPNSNDEIAELTISFNKMTDRIQQAFLFQQQFSVNVAHELRTPLTIMKTKLDVFEKKQHHTITEYETFIQKQKQQIIRLSEIIQTLLESINTDYIQDQERILASDIIENIILDLDDLLKQKSISISTKIEQIEVYGNVDMLYRIFFNVLHNCIRYNVENGHISIKAQQNNYHTTIEICDTGIGIPKKDRERVFEPFYRIDQSISKSYKGTGLGLFIVKTLVEKHNGTIIITNRNPKGTCFTITLPFHKTKS